MTGGRQSAVREELAQRAAALRTDLEARWGPARRGSHAIEVEGAFPDGVEALPPWIALVVVSGEGGRALLIHDEAHPFGWELPGGKAEPRESVERTATRELREETGVAAEIRGLLRTELLELDYGDGRRAPVLQAVFGAERTDGEARPREPGVSAVRWFARDELPADAAFREDVTAWLDRGGD